MTTNATIGLISAICLGLVILWDYFRRKKEIRDKEIRLKIYNESPSYGTENGKIHVVLGQPYSYTWNDVSNNDLATHEKVLEDIKKVEKINDPPLPPQDHR